MTHAHWLQMGGLRLTYIQGELDTINAHYYDSHGQVAPTTEQAYCYSKSNDGVRNVVLVVDDFRGLLAEGKIDFPDISEEDIKDRSKSDGLSKGVALLQITWFVMQLITRARQHLVITEIELTTAALAGLNSIMYLFWWSKPLDARSPIVVRTRGLERLLVDRTERKVLNRDDGELSERVKWMIPVEDDEGLTPNVPQLRIHILRMARDFAKRVRTLAPTSRMLPDAFTCWRQFTSRTRTIVTSLRSTFFESNAPDPSNFFTIRGAIRSIWANYKLVIAKLCYFPYLLMFIPLQRIIDPSRYVGLEQGFIDAKHKMDTKPTRKLLFNEDDMKWMMGMMFYSEKSETKVLLYFSALAGAAFGSAHCVAWNFNFPSHVEKVLWRSASLSIVGVCLCSVAGLPLHNVTKRKLSFKWKPSLQTGLGYSIVPVKNMWYISQRALETVPAIIYPLARISLLVLALLSLRNLPDSAFETAPWTASIPHV